ncbi:PaaI family thioesterase [Actinocorallia populi]|uniref:PaaI family thioesterase n=1 Tax=Actinocorallia populi TaxID=2079200 RepID=UPI000D08EC6A|nr:PaaI family thioesterase [Actinocorallia populi]
MSGTRTHPIFTVQPREPVSERRIEYLSRLAARVRELNEAAVLTDLPEEELAEVTAQVEALTARLGAVRRTAPPVVDVEGGGIMRQLAGPVNGALNPIAPPCDVRFLPDGSVRSEFTLNSVYEGPPGMVHGGVSAMILDQLLGMAADSNGTPGLTASLELLYRRPTMLGEPLVAEARIDRVEGRRAHAAGRILNSAGKPTIEATAMFVMPL